MTLKTLPVIQPPSSPLQQSPRSVFPWLILDTKRRIFFFIIFSPILLPLFCLSFPFICIGRLYVCLCQRRRRREKRRREDRLRRCEEGRPAVAVEVAVDREIGWLLMQRYLEDQLGLVADVVNVYDCGQDDDDDDNDDNYYYKYNYNSNGNGNGVNLGESRRPLLV
ncbi:uncharacterized protein LOC141658536 [Silene latifolia]|uniref:uncharacterized protein LOC141658536 n=1 Tax=Silene latifolia TaxID=37657 RepID=UPI003D781C9A